MNNSLIRPGNPLQMIDDRNLDDLQEFNIDNNFWILHQGEAICAGHIHTYGIRKPIETNLAGFGETSKRKKLFEYIRFTIFCTPNQLKKLLRIMDIDRKVSLAVRLRLPDNEEVGAILSEVFIGKMTNQPLFDKMLGKSKQQVEMDIYETTFTNAIIAESFKHSDYDKGYQNFRLNNPLLQIIDALEERKYNRVRKFPTTEIKDIKEIEGW